MMERGQRQAEIFSNLRDKSRDSIEWREKQIELMQQLDKRLQLAEQLVQITENISKQTSAEDLLDILNNFIIEVSQQTPESVKQQVNRLEDLYSKLELQRAKITWDTDTVEVTPDIQGQNEAALAEMDILQPEFYELLNNPSAKFFFDLKNMVEELKSKMKFVSEMGKDEDSVLRALAEVRNTDFVDLKNRLEVREIKFGPYWVTLVVEDLNKIYDRDDILGSDREDVLGLYTRGSPFIIVEAKDTSPAEIEDTEKHERVHLLLDGSQHFMSASKPFDSLTFFNKYENPGIRSFPDLRDKEKVLKRQNSIYNPINFFNHFHNELLAEDEVGELQRYFQKGKFYEPRNLSIQELNKMVPMLATAGNDLVDSISSLRQVQKNNIDPEITAIAKKLDKGLITEFESSLGALGYAYNLTARMGESAKRDVEVLTYILMPNQYRHIPHFLNYKYGEELIKKATDSAKEAYEFDPHKVESVDKLTERLQKKP